MNINEEISAFMETNFARRLQAEGFCSYRNNMRHWYKLVDESVLQMVILDYHRGDKKHFDFWYGSVPLYIPFPLPYTHDQYIQDYDEILLNANGKYEVQNNLGRYDQPLSVRNYHETVRRYTGAFEEIIWPLFYKIHNLETCHKVWWETWTTSPAYRYLESPYYTMTRGIWELVYGHHKRELYNYVQQRYVENVENLKRIIHAAEQTPNLGKFATFARTAYPLGVRIIHDVKTDNWDDLDLLIQENMLQMRELVRKKLKL